MSEITFTDQNFEKEVLKSDVPVLVDFWAPWCGPCLMLAPVISELAKEYEGKKVTIGKMNVGENQDTPQKYNIMGIPNLKLFKDGEVVDEIVSAEPKEEIKKHIDKLLK